MSISLPPKTRSYLVPGLTKSPSPIQYLLLDQVRGWEVHSQALRKDFSNGRLWPTMGFVSRFPGQPWAAWVKPILFFFLSPRGISPYLELSRQELLQARNWPFMAKQLCMHSKSDLFPISLPDSALDQSWFFLGLLANQDQAGCYLAVQVYIASPRQKNHLK